jgi:hypothetical protein
MILTYLMPFLLTGFQPCMFLGNLLASLAQALHRGAYRPRGRHAHDHVQGGSAARVLPCTALCPVAHSVHGHYDAPVAALVTLLPFLSSSKFLRNSFLVPCTYTYAMSTPTIKAFHDAIHSLKISSSDNGGEAQMSVALHYTLQLATAIHGSSSVRGYNIRDLFALSGSISSVLEVGDKIRILHRETNTRPSYIAILPNTHEKLSQYLLPFCEVYQTSFPS